MRERVTRHLIVVLTSEMEYFRSMAGSKPWRTRFTGRPLLLLKRDYDGMVVEDLQCLLSFGTLVVSLGSFLFA